MKPEPERRDFQADTRYDYVKAQLRARHEDLEALVKDYHATAIKRPEYLSCRRSLLQAINELEHLLSDRGAR